MTRVEAQHDEACPDIGPICEVRAEPAQQHHTTLWLTEARLLGEYGLGPNFALQAVIPFRIVGTTTRYTDLAGNPVQLDYENIHHHNETLAGLGDAQLLLHGALKRDSVRLGGRLGLSFPTGKVQPNPFKLEALGLPHEHLQFGTGTFDPVVGLDLSQQFSRFSLALFGQTQLPLYEGAQGYQAGVRVAGGFVAVSSLGLSGPSFRLGLTTLHEFAERWDGVIPLEDGNRGRTDVFVTTGMTIPFASDWSVSLDLRARAFGEVVGAQLSIPLVVELSLGRLFHFEAGSDEEETLVRGDIEDVVHAGEATALTSVPGKWTVFDFWAPWCEACKTLDSELRALASDDATLALRRVNIVDFDSPIALQELQGVSVLPHVRIVNPEGKTTWEGSGPPDELLRQITGR